MLFTDEVFVTQADLLKIESEITTVATTEVIDIDDVIQSTYEEFGDWIMSKMQAMTGYPPFNVPLSASVAFSSLINQASNRTRVTLSQIVVNDGQYLRKNSPLKTLVIYQCLENFYRQASRRREVDRFEEKRDDYADEIRRKYMPRFRNNGLPIVNRPFFSPGSLLEDGSGSWGDANLTALSGTPGTGSDPHYDVVITWVDSSVYISAANPVQGESGPSGLATIQLTAGDRAIVDITHLTAPNGTFRASALANVPIKPMTTTGWNVYAGPVGGTLTLQNASPVPYATKTLTLAVSLLTSGQPVGSGQHADQSLPIEDMFDRA